MAIKRMDHFTVVTDRLAETISFYGELGLRCGDRPDFGIPGAWLYLGERAVLHLIEVREMPDPRRGALDHMAYWSEDLPATVKWLEDAQVRHRIIRAPRPFRMWQLFCEDPNGVEVELDFDAAEIAPEDWRTRGHTPPSSIEH